MYFQTRVHRAARNRRTHAIVRHAWTSIGLPHPACPNSVNTKSRRQLGVPIDVQGRKSNGATEPLAGSYLSLSKISIAEQSVRRSNLSFDKAATDPRAADRLAIVVHPARTHHGNTELAAFFDQKRDVAFTPLAKSPVLADIHGLKVRQKTFKPWQKILRSNTGKNAGERLLDHNFNP